MMETLSCKMVSERAADEFWYEENEED